MFPWAVTHVVFFCNGLIHVMASDRFSSFQFTFLQRHSDCCFVVLYNEMCESLVQLSLEISGSDKVCLDCKN